MEYLIEYSIVKYLIVVALVDSNRYVIYDSLLQFTAVLPEM